MHRKYFWKVICVLFTSYTRNEPILNFYLTLSFKEILWCIYFIKFYLKYENENLIFRYHMIEIFKSSQILLYL